MTLAPTLIPNLEIILACEDNGLLLEKWPSCSFYSSNWQLKNLAESSETENQAIWIVDQRYLQTLPAARQAQLLGARTILLIERGLEESVQRLIEHRNLNHLHIRNERCDATFLRQLSLTVTKLSGPNRGGLNSYLKPGAVLTQLSLTHSDTRQSHIDKIKSLADGRSCFPEFGNAAATIASELLMNAIFNAPHDREQLQPRYRDRPRNESLALGGGEEVSLSFGYDDAFFVIGLRDNFGMLSRDVLIANLARAASRGGSQVQMQTAGAGVGLYMVLSLANQLDIQVQPKVSTEIVALIALSKRHIDFERRGNSLNYFQLGAVDDHA